MHLTVLLRPSPCLSKYALCYLPMLSGVRGGAFKNILACCGDEQALQNNVSGERNHKYFFLLIYLFI